MTINILVPRVDVALLKLQRDAVLESINDAEDLSTYSGPEISGFRRKQIEHLEGVVNLLDVMIDVAMDKEEA